MNKTFYPIALLAFVLTKPVNANEFINDCKQNSKSKKDYALCLEKRSQQLERELELWNNNHVFRLEEQAKKTGRTSSLKLFKRAQDDFVVYRESNCRWYYLADTPNPTAGNEYKKCMIKLTKLRIDELESIGGNED